MSCSKVSHHILFFPSSPSLPPSSMKLPIIINLLDMSLDQKTAIKRASLIRQDSISYNFHIILETALYHGLAELTFYLETLPQADLLLDYSGDQVEELIINGLQPEFDDEKRENFIILPKRCLQKGKNRVTVLYNSEFNNDQSGLISFTDNGKQFLYTDFEPYGANRVFPCFDQPDLKAYMNLTVVGPDQWRILSHQDPISNESFRAEKYVRNGHWWHEGTRHLLDKFAKRVKDRQNSKLTVFPTTKKLPSYIFCFCAGDYKEIQCPYPDPPVKMSLFCIPDAVPKLQKNSKLIFDTTIACMNLFKEKFGLAYPFPKYDQIFIRQFGAFAMENAGIVTFSEQDMFPQDNLTQYDKYTIALVVSHELSHHWFGNYVTMKWWDDLWLNESFAEWISCYSLEKLKAQLGFQSYFYFRDGKIRGYRDDERSNSNHPIRGTVANTSEAFSIFDGITYEKGASALKQLLFLVEQEPFFQGVQNYFSRFEWGNATIDDFLEDIGVHFPKEAGTIGDWRKKWLETASLNVFQIDWDQANSQITLRQSPFDDSDILRVHKLRIALFNPDGTISQTAILDVLTDSASKVVAYTAGPYSAVLVNYEDWTFAQNIIDPVSLQFFMNNIDKVADSFTRIMIWYNFRSMVNSSRMGIADYVGLIRQKLFTQKETFILERILENLRFYLSDFIEEALGNAYRSALWTLIYQQLQEADNAHAERVQILQDNLIAYSKTDKQINALWNWLNQGDASLVGKDMTIDQQYKAALKILTLPILQSIKWDIFYQIRDKDTAASRKQDYETIVTVLLSNETDFEKVYQQFKGTEVSLSVKYLKVEGWRNDYHQAWISKYQDRYFDDIPKVSQALSYEEFEFFYTALRPLHYDLQTQVDKYNQAILQLERLGDLEEHCRNLRKFIDDISLRMQNISFNADTNLALSQARAIHRYSYIKPTSVSYVFHLAFAKQSDYYEGLAQISFELTRLPSVLPVDCVCDAIHAVLSNKLPVQLIQDGEFIFIPQAALQIGKNTLSIRYTNKFNNDGLGCMSFLQAVDPEPIRQYIYTNFEPYGAHRFVPCFDQPDFRASAQFNTILPSGWMAVGNENWQYQGDFSITDYKQAVATQNAAELDNFLKNKSGYFYKLAPTMPISTYLYCIAVGEYYSIKAPDAVVGTKTIPMSLYCIQSYKSRLNRMQPFITEITVLAIQLFSEDFGYPYPFNKYDTIFCHEYKPGAMENPGLITFKDTYLFPEEVSLQKMLGLASTIVHECSHNWFGNLVTMKWWDDLWLNESFADFIAHYGLQQIKDKVTTIPTYDSGWKIFLVRGVAGYREDQITATTHAVRSVVENTSVASTYFDRITYQKGSACLKQFMFLMTKENFLKGLNDYFKAYEWKNTTIDDFLGKMQPYFNIKDFTLDDWKNSWLLTPSLNTVSIEWDPTNLSLDATFTIKQECYTDVYPTLRYHQTRVALFKDDCTYDVLDVLITPTPTTTVAYDGTQGYKAILVNYEYWSYFKYSIDAVSLAFFEKNLNNITTNPQDVLTRMIIWHDLNEQVRDASYQVQDFVNIFRKFVFDQPDDKIFEFQFSFVRDALNNYFPNAKAAPSKIAIFQDVWNEIQSMRPNSLDNRLILLKDQLTVFASQPSQILRLEEWRQSFDPSADPDKFAITVTQAWQVVKLFFTLPSETIQSKRQAYNDQFGISGGIQGKLVGNTCNTLVADDAEMLRIFNEFKQANWSVDSKESYLAGWNNRVHLDLLTNTYKAQYFQNIPLLSKALPSVHFEFFYQGLKPIDEDLQGSIAGYEKIKLQGSEMIGHMKVLTQIKYGYELRKKLFAFNA